MKISKIWKELHNKAAKELAKQLYEALVPIIRKEWLPIRSQHGLFPDDDYFVYAAFRIGGTGYGIVVMHEIGNEEYFDLNIVEYNDSGLDFEPVNEAFFSTWETLEKNLVAWAKRQETYCPECDGEGVLEEENGDFVTCGYCEGKESVPIF